MSGRRPLARWDSERIGILSEFARGLITRSRPTLRICILRERWRASRLPSVPSALRGLDPRHAHPLTGNYRSVGECGNLSTDPISRVSQRAPRQDQRSRSAAGPRRARPPAATAGWAECAYTAKSMCAQSRQRVPNIPLSKRAPPGKRGYEERRNLSDYSHAKHHWEHRKPV
jgi:hypothetical protein